MGGVTKKEYLVTMVCKEIWRAKIFIDSTTTNKEKIKDEAWAKFDKVCKKDLEQENYTKVEQLKPSRGRKSHSHPRE